MKNAAISMRGFVIWKIFRIANGYLSVVEVRGVYGLPSEHWKAIYRIFYAQKTRLRWVKLFGSRVRGEARATSDVELVPRRDDSTFRVLL